MKASVNKNARVAKPADAKDLKSFFTKVECGFKSRPGHHFRSETLNGKHSSKRSGQSAFVLHQFVWPLSNIR